jgi:2-keto-3-deoxy-L-rhamnonate aldolase RhmA
MFHNLNSPTLVEVMGAAGHRFVIFDQEHTSTNHETLVSLIRAAELHDMMVLVRIEGPSPAAAIKALDAGAHGVWVQHLADAEAVRNFVGACLYPPMGDRGYCTFPRANNNGIGEPMGWIQHSNTDPLFVIGLNNEEILEELEEVMSIPRADVFALNVADVIVRTGYGDYDDFFQMHNIAKGVNKSIREAGKLVMMPFFAPDMGNVEEAREYLSEELADIWFTADIGCFLNGLGKLMQIQKALIGDQPGKASAEETADSGENATDEDAKGDADSGPDFVRTC